MFGDWITSSSSTKKDSKSKKISSVQNDILTGLTFEIPKDIESLTSADLEDPELLKELEQLTENSDTVKVSKQQVNSRSLAPENVDAELTNVEYMLSSVDIEVDFDEKDMENPELLNELAQITGESSQMKDTSLKETIEHPSEHDPSNRETGSNDPVDQIDSKVHMEPDANTQDSEDSSDELPLQYKLQSTSIPTLKKYVEIEKRKAALFKRNGDLTKARFHYVAFKQLQERSVILGKEQKAFNDIERLLKQRFNEYKEASIQCKNLKNIPLATEYLNTAKRIKHLLETKQLVKSKVPESPKIPETSSQTDNEDNFIAQQKDSSFHVQRPEPVETDREIDGSIQTASLSSPNDSEKIKCLIGKIQTQLDESKKVSSAYFTREDKANALVFHKIRKRLEIDLKYIEEFNGVPSFHFESINYSYENQFNHLSMNDVELGVIRANGLSSKSVLSSEIDSYVEWDFGWPTDGSNTFQSSGTTNSVKKTMDPKYDYNKILKIERTKPFQRFLERRKVTFEVFHYRGILRKSISLGKAQVKLDKLLSLCEIHEKLPLTDSKTRRPLGGFLEIFIRLREPFLKKHISAKKDDQWVFLDRNGKFADDQMLLMLKNTDKEKLRSTSQSKVERKISSRILSSASSSNAQKSSSPRKSPELKSSPKSKKISHTNEAPALETDTEVDALLQQLDDIDQWVSDAVKEEELQSCRKQSAAYKVKGIEIPMDLEQKMQHLQTNIQLQVMEVQSGKLTLPDYLAKVKQSILENKKLAQKLKRLNKIEHAKLALHRAKIMEKEVSEVEQSEL